jgi:hypothetical protein
MTLRRLAPLAVLVVAAATLAVLGLNWAGLDVGNVAEWAAAVGTVLAVTVALLLSRSDRKHQIDREAEREAGLVIVEVAPGGVDPTDALKAGLGRSSVRGQIKNYGPTPLRNVRALMTWTHGQASVDDRGRVVNRTAAEYAARHIDPYVIGAQPAWFPFWAQGDVGSPPEVESFTVSWQDRWGTWWATSAGGLPERLELRLKPLPVETFDRATREVIESVRLDQAAESQGSSGSEN